MRAVRIIGPALLASHLLLRLLNQSFWSEIILYNIVGFFAVFSIYLAKPATNLIARNATIIGISTWVVGSVIAGLSKYYATPSIAIVSTNLLYLVFYPSILIGLIPLIETNRDHKLLDIVDALIIGLGSSTLGTALLLKPVLPNFDGDLINTSFAIIFPIADLMLISVVITFIAVKSISKRGLIICTGIVIFAATDFLYLWLTVNSNYEIGSIVDDGWILGILIIAESFWHSGNNSTVEKGASPVLITISVFLSATFLALIALRSDFLPLFILIPAIATLALAFTRMTIAMNQSRHIGQERLLARTDELTGLPNRRRLISEIEAFVAKEGSLLLLDLDGFKPINDLHGHETGDKVLQQVARRFDRALPNGALLARLGGDEFGVLFEGAQESAVEVALALHATLSYPFQIDDKEIRLGVSIGVARNNGGDDLLLRADNAMYKAKREGLGVCPL